MAYQQRRIHKKSKQLISDDDEPSILPMKKQKKQSPIATISANSTSEVILEADLETRSVTVTRSPSWICPTKSLSGELSIDTRSASNLKKTIEKLEAEKKTMAEQLKTMQEQILELSVNCRNDDDNDTSGSGVHQKGSGTWHSNDIKVNIPKYDGKLDPDEFVEWLRTVEYAFDYKETTVENKVKNCGHEVEE
ncbi:hypothetical protein Tco_0132866, partial [Tanacetum coccineum]